MRAAVVARSLCLFCLGLTPAAAAEPRGPADCARTLDCTIHDIDRMSMADRLAFVQRMSAGPAAELLPGYAPRWRNIEDIIAFFSDHDLGAPGTWISYVDAGILEGIERGLAIALGRGDDTFGNPGARRWARYLMLLRDGELTARSVHDRVWSEAEQAATEHGVRVAEQVHGVAPDGVEQRFFAYSEFYRWVLRNRPALVDPVSPGAEPGDQRQVTFVDWFTDVTNPTPAHRGAELALNLAAFDALGGTVSGLALLHAYVRYLGPDHLADTTRSTVVPRGTTVDLREPTR